MTIRCSCSSSGHDEEDGDNDEVEAEEDWFEVAAVVALLKCCKHSKHPLGGAGDPQASSAMGGRSNCSRAVATLIGGRSFNCAQRQINTRNCGKLQARRRRDVGRGGAGPDIDMQQATLRCCDVATSPSVRCVGDSGAKHCRQHSWVPSLSISLTHTLGISLAL